MAENTEAVNHEKKEITLLDFVTTYRLYKKKILLTALVFGILTALLVFFVIKPVFLSTGTIKTSGKVPGLSLGGALPEITEFGEVIGGGAYAKELEFYEDILTSRRCLEETIIKFNLMEEYDYLNMQRAIKDFRENILYITKDKVSGVMIMGVYDTSPERSKDISDFLIAQLNKINTELNVQSAKNQREFIEQRYNEAIAKLREAEDSLRIFQDIYGIAPDIVVREASELEITLEAEIQSEEIKLELLRKVLSPNEEEVRMQEQKIAALRERLSNIQNSTDGSSKLQLKGTPQMVLNFLRARREVEIQTKILNILLPLYENSKIEEKKELPSVLVLDQPFIPDEKTKPKRMTTIFVVMVLAAFMAYIFFFVRYQLRRMRVLEKV